MNIRDAQVLEACDTFDEALVIDLESARNVAPFLMEFCHMVRLDGMTSFHLPGEEFNRNVAEIVGNVETLLDTLHFLNDPRTVIN